MAAATGLPPPPPDNNTNTETAAAAATRLPPPPPLGVSSNTVANRQTGLAYINRYLREAAPFGDDNIETFDQITDLHMEGDNLQRLVHGFYLWLANTAIRTNQQTWLSTDKKVQYQKYAKQVMKEKFPLHSLFSAEYNEWHEDMVKKFKAQCDRSRQLDENIHEVRKSEPLYRDISDRDKCTAVRAKFLGINVYDCSRVSINLLKRVKDLNTAAALAEFNLCRAASGRGGEHALLRWDEGTYDPFYRAPDFDWPIMKQLDRQCMFFFCDLSVYTLCPYFGLGVYFLYGGIRRDDADLGATKNFIFPHLHKSKRNNVAKRLTTQIRGAIDDENRKKAYTSRSTRKGGMGDARMSCDLNLTEEYAHSGHHHASMNSNAEGYIESNPAINAPGAMAAAGYTNCHMRPWPYTFEILGIQCFDTVQRLVSEMFINDLPRLQVGGNLRPVIMMCAARLIGDYNNLIGDLGTDHKVVKLIMAAARQANVDDVRVTDMGQPRYHVVLKDWSRQITEKFMKDNDQVSSDNPKVNEELLRVLIDKVHKLDASVAAHDDRDRHLGSALDQIDIQKYELASKIKEIKRQGKLIDRLQRSLQTAHQMQQEQASSPESPIHHHDFNFLADVAAKRPPILDLDSSEFAPASKKTTAANSTDVPTKLDGVLDITKKKSVAGIKVSDELERMWDEKVLVKMSKELEGERVLSKDVLFTRSRTCVHGHPAFKENSELAKYDAGMIFVALALSDCDDDWKKLCAGELDDLARRHLFAKIEKDTMFKACEIEMQLVEKAKQGSKATVHSLGSRFKDMTKKKKNSDRQFDINDYVRRKLGESDGKKQQTKLGFSSKNA